MSSFATGLREALQDRSWRGALVPTAALLVALAVVSRVLYRFAQLDEAAYRSFSISVAALRTPALLALVFVPAGIFVWLRRGLRWSDIPDGHLVRVLVLATAGSLALHFAFYEPNWFLAQSHLLDRSLLVALLVVAWWRPIALLPFTILAAIIASQFAVPLGRYTWNDKRVVFDAVILFCIAAGSGIIRRREGVQAFIGSVGVVLVSWYLVAGAAKIALLWPGREELAYMTRSAHLAGWLATGTANGVADLVAGLNGVLVPLTIAVEVAAVFLLKGRRPALAVLIATQGLHLAVFLVSGIFFWKWMVLEAALIVFFVRCDRQILAGFGPALIVLSLPFAALSPRLFGVATLAWYDTPYSVNLEFEAVGASGVVYRLAPDQLAPYDVLFAQGRLGFLARPEILVGSLGTALDWSMTSRLYQAESVEDIADVEAEFARSQYNEADAQEFDRFIRARVRRWSEQPTLHPPHHIWTGQAPRLLGGPQVGYADQEELTDVRVRMYKVWWDSDEYRRLADCVVREVAIDEPTRPSLVAPDTACAV